LMVIPAFEAFDDEPEGAMNLMVELLGRLGGVNKPLVWKV